MAFWILETEQQLNILKRLNYKEAFIEIVGIDIELHPVENEISFIYLRPKYATNGYILPIKHSEGLSLDLKLVTEYLKNYDNLYTIDKKKQLHYIKLSNYWDIMIPPNNYDLKISLEYQTFKRLNNEHPFLNYIFPLSKHFEMLDILYNDVMDKCVVPQTEYANFYNNKVVPIYAYIEKNGITIDKEIFGEFFYKTNKNKVYTQYNTKTLTTRPSNSFKGVNYAALNKKNGSRKSFIPTKGNKLVEIDFTAYHPSIISKLIKYDFKGQNIHEYFAKMYDVDYDKAKQLTFKQIYGNVFPQYKHLKFFQDLQTLINNIWDDFNNNGFYECPISKYRFIKNNMDDMHPTKLFNYVCQNMETSNNILILIDIIKLFHKKKSKIIMVTYDSILFDFYPPERNLLKDVKRILGEHKFMFKMVSGDNYGELG